MFYFDNFEIQLEINMQKSGVKYEKLNFLSQIFFLLHISKCASSRHVADFLQCI